MKKIRLLFPLLILLVAVLCFAPTAAAFCGFYVAKADTKLYNKASQVVMARNGEQTVITMANDFQGEVKDFAIVVPVPTVLKKEQVHVAEAKIIERLDAFSAPRLVEYFDPDPCNPPIYDALPVPKSPQLSAGFAKESLRTENLGVKIEARFSVGEYDILILSAKESGGLETWLNRNGYRIPKGARELLKPYVRSSMKFFVAKVNLDKFEASGYQLLRPIQISYQSPKFMLPIRLGMINANQEQDLLVYVLSPKGQAEITNYRTVKIPSNTNIPVFVKNEFGDFYKSLFKTSYEKEDRRVAFVEYAWDMSNCDPCSADPLNPEELKQAGVFWLNNPESSFANSGVFITRLHIRYTRDKFPEDPMFQETANRESFQGRYILQHPFTGKTQCQAGREYRRSLRPRFEQEAQNLAHLTNWNINDIRQKMKLNFSHVDKSWWNNFIAWLGIQSHV